VKFIRYFYSVIFEGQKWFSTCFSLLHSQSYLPSVSLFFQAITIVSHQFTMQTDPIWIRTHTHSLSFSLYSSLTHTLFFVYTRTFTHSLSLSPSFHLSLSLSLSFSVSLLRTHTRIFYLSLLSLFYIYIQMK